MNPNYTWKHPVRLLQIILTNQCNLQCKYCYVNQHPKKMSIEILDKIINLIKYKLIKLDGFNIDLFGGEAMLCFNEIKYLITHLPQTYPITIYTNATLFTKENLTFLNQYPNVCFNFSLDGIEEMHNASRLYKNGQGSYQEVIQGIQLYSEIYQIPAERIGVKTVLSSYNFQFLLPTLQKIKENQLPYYYNFTLDRHSHWDKESIVAFKKEYLKAADYYIQNIDYFSRLNLFLQDLYIYSEYTPGICDAVDKCGQLCIGPDEQLYTCEGFIGTKYTIGDLNQGININSKAFLELSKCSLYTLEECKNCELNRYHSCLGPCPAAILESTNSLHHTIPEVCEITKFRLKVALDIYNKLKYNNIYLYQIQDFLQARRE